MTVYYFKAASWLLKVLTPLISGGIILIIVLTTGILPKGNPIMIVLFFGGSALLITYLTRLAAFAKVEVTLSVNSISIKWLQHFLVDSGPDGTIPFKEIAEYVNQSDSNWEWIKIKLKNNAVFQIWHYKQISKDDYRRFISDFVYAVESYNESIEDNINKNENVLTPNIIHKGKSFYETTWGLIIGITIVIFLLGIIILIIVSPSKNAPNYWILGILSMTAIYYVLQIFSSRQKKK